jgi:hypothetical protein
VAIDNPQAVRFCNEQIRILPFRALHPKRLLQRTSPHRLQDSFAERRGSTACGLLRVNHPRLKSQVSLRSFYDGFERTPVSGLVVVKTVPL